MKYVSFLALLVVVAACNTTVKESAGDAAHEERAIGFNTMLPELKWHLGTEEAITLVTELDTAWAAKDYAAMRTFFADTAKCYFPDGKVANSADEFIEIIKAEIEDADVSWTFDYAFSVDLDPTQGGEHVQAGFTGTTVIDGTEKKDRVHESYYIIDGKIVMWSQFKMEILPKE